MAHALEQERIRTVRLQTVLEAAATVSHEINNPLGALVLNAEVATMLIDRGRADELPAVLTKKEGVFTEGQMKAMAPVSSLAAARGNTVNLTFAPHIDARTMEIHHGKHHAAYIAKLTDAMKALGGSCREMGLMFLVFIPVPYVDASESVTLPGKWQRMLIGAAGMIAELGLAAIAVPVWVASFAGWLPPEHFNRDWHAHEMLFGYLGAIVAGFLLTAIPNWTGRPVLKGAPLAALVALWLGGRIAVLASAEIGWLMAAIADTSFLVVMAIVAAREILKAKNRNLPLVAAISLLAAANLFDHLGAAGRGVSPDLGWQMAFAIILLLIGLIGGRIIATFTRNWLMARGEHEGLPPAFNTFDKVVLGTTLVALISWIAAREHSSGHCRSRLRDGWGFGRQCPTRYP